MASAAVQAGSSQKKAWNAWLRSKQEGRPASGGGPTRHVRAAPSYPTGRGPFSVWQRMNTRPAIPVKNNGSRNRPRAARRRLASMVSPFTAGGKSRHISMVASASQTSGR